QLALPTQTGNGQRVDLNVVLRHQPGFHRPLGAQPGHWNPALAQHLGHGQAREDVTTGSAGHDHHRTCVLRFVRETHQAILPKVGSTRCCMRLLPRAAPDCIAGATAVTVVGVTAALVSASAISVSATSMSSRTSWRRTARLYS